MSASRPRNAAASFGIWSGYSLVIGVLNVCLPTVYRPRATCFKPSSERPMTPSMLYELLEIRDSEQKNEREGNQSLPAKIQKLVDSETRQCATHQYGGKDQHIDF